jgi:tetratricopeptide (TPR) repeat protein
MKSILWIFSLAVVLGIIGCANPAWVQYRSAMKCHFQDKDEECNKHYEKAIKLDKDLPGVYLSYASHLYKHGNTTEAQEKFIIEIEKHPEVEKAIRIIRDKATKPSADQETEETGDQETGQKEETEEDEESEETLDEDANQEEEQKSDQEKSPEE